jgi:hypothetical protein
MDKKRNSLDMVILNYSLSQKIKTKKWYLGLILILSTSGVIAGNLTGGIGIGNSYAMVAPCIGYNFDNGIGIDLSLTYIDPGFDYTTGIKYSLPLRRNILIGPKVIYGKRETKGFKSEFVGLSANTTIFFTHNSFLDFQVGIENNSSYKKLSDSLLNVSGFLPQLGIAYGFAFGRAVKTANIPSDNFSNNGNALLTAGQAGGAVIALAGAILATSAASHLGTFSHGIPEFACIIGGGSFGLGAISFLICSRIKDKNK